MTIASGKPASTAVPATPEGQRRLTTAHTSHPQITLLSNRQYSVMVTNAGSGYSTWRDLDLTRWREDGTRDNWGQYCYLRDLGDGRIWSVGHQPLGRAADDYEVVYSADRAEFRRRDGGIETCWEITVSPEYNAEVRRLTLTNHDSQPHDLELTSYAEVALNPRRADQAHPAFGKLFLETEHLPDRAALLCRRRPRSQDQKPIWAVHVLSADGPANELQYETDRARFLGRGRCPAHPAALDPGSALSGTTGPVLDPIFSLRCRVRVPPGGSAAVAFTTAVAQSRDEALSLAGQYRSFPEASGAFDLARSRSQTELRDLGLSPGEAQLFQRLAGHVIYTGPAFRPPAAVAANRLGQPGLWPHGISGDRPIVLVRLAGADDLPLTRQLLQAHAYWRLKGLEVDLVVLDEAPVGGAPGVRGRFAPDADQLHRQLQDLARGTGAGPLMDKPGGVFLRPAARLPEEDKILLQAAARVVLEAGRGTLAAQLDLQEAAATQPGPVPAEPGRKSPIGITGRGGEAVNSSDLLFFNGLGGFTPDGSEYVILIDEEAALPRVPPAPWVNVVANPNFGFLISEGGSGYTWAGNSQMNRLTTWSNDPVADPPSEAVYLRDEATGEFWTPTPRPRGGSGPVEVRHGQGYTRFARHSHGLEQELLVLVAPEDPVKLLRLKVRNTGGQARRLSAVFYAEWVLGTIRDQAPQQVVCSFDPDSDALLARSAWAGEFADRVAFADVNLRPHSYTADRAEFLGRNGSLAAPAALSGVVLSGAARPALDPCAALRVEWELPPGEEKEIVFLLGQAAGVDEARRLLRAYRAPGGVERALEEVRARWERVLGAVQVRTPDPALDLLVNRWLPYQVLACRVWGRSGFYQSGGAYGFRDQLQDVMALVYGAPDEARAQILRAAARQFQEGDVQHWWHPPAGRGVRTRITDDLMFLPLVVCHYLETTGDTSLLEVRVPFLRAPVLRPDQEEDYGLPEVAEETGTVYEHCARALEHGYRVGPHGLPLMGTGDWNDGMNKVGAEGKGESVWNGWFFVTVLKAFAELAGQRGDALRAAWCRERAEALRLALEEHAWDGGWYRRAYFDDGTPLGSAQNDECQIDALPQAWAVISGAADPARAEQALAAVERRLVRPDGQLIQLFDPPFDKGSLQPGYIKGYVPGIRENGGQYTHAATWVVLATALLGRGGRALELFSLLNPIRHATSPEGVARYQVEPYVVAADVYGAPPHTGRGGWTWYTGSASWLYRVALEAILGFRLRGTTLRLEPCVVPGWPQYEITYRHGSATYRITVENPGGTGRGVRSLSVDGQALPGERIELEDDGKHHEARVVLG